MRGWKECASLLLVLAGSAQAGVPCTARKVEISTQRGVQRFKVELATTQEARERGLSGRDRLLPDTGMWFVMAETGMPGFWMRGMKFPIDLIWVDQEKRVVGAVTLPVCAQEPCPVTYPPSAVTHVLEIAAGRFSGRVGDRVTWGCR